MSLSNKGAQFIRNTSVRSKLLLCFFCYLFLLFVTYGRYVDNPFVMDDEIQIVNNVSIQSNHNWSEFWSSSTMDSGGMGKLGGVYYKPLMTTYYALVWNAFGMDPSAFRIPLWILHVLSAMLICILATQWMSYAWAFLWGLLFLLHPINSEVLFYLADAQDVLYLFFGLSALVGLRFIRHQGFAIVLCVFCMLASIFSKETGALFLFIMPVYSYFFQRKRFRAVVLICFCILVFYICLRHAIGLTALRSAWLHIGESSLLERLQLLPWIVGHYIEIFFWPQRLSLTTDVQLSRLPDFNYWFGCAVMVVFISFFIYLVKQTKIFLREKLFFIFFSWILLLWAGLHLHLFVPLDGAYADRWFYLASWPMLGIFLLILRDVKFRSKSSIVTVVMILLCAMIARDYCRGRDWSDTLQLYSRENELHPWDAVMSNNVGVELFRRGQVAQSLNYFQHATEMNSGWDVAWSNLGASLERQDKLQPALAAYAKAISLGSYALAYENYGYLLLRLGQEREAESFVNKYLPMFPYNKRLQQLAQILKDHQRSQ